METTENNEESKTLELGGNIELNGFSEIDRGNMIIVKKIVGSYVKRINEHGKEISKLSLSLKRIHNDQGKGKFEIKAKSSTTKGDLKTSETVSNNLFFALDEVLKKIEVQLS